MLAFLALVLPMVRRRVEFILFVSMGSFVNGIEGMMVACIYYLVFSPWTEVLTLVINEGERRGYSFPE